MSNSGPSNGRIVRDEEHASQNTSCYYVIFINIDFEKVGNVCVSHQKKQGAKK